MNSTRLKWVLLVDDDGTTNMLNKLFLKKLIPDLDIDTVTDGHRALDFIEANINDIEQGSFLLILDIEMPIMNGWQFLEAFDILFRKEEKEKIVIAVLTANSCEEVTYRALANPRVKECLQKPLSDINFRSIIQTYFYD
ncbi:response regulator [Arenibacter troitsensis]|uniref:Response regulator receiver domain-containing protein n=1 Tax=Arenibacter troitsensis TaxID=188872 RepID=A0A1X7JEW4_9FLAO|nr:response regulator [Arenibacter troitsensis]SMG26429.1 Response regulator receiver domain-containing protein [Arenibacter troitsensis]